MSPAEDARSLRPPAPRGTGASGSPTAVLRRLLHLSRQPVEGVAAGAADRLGRTAATGAALGTVSSLSALGLMATSAFLLARAAERPPLLSLTVALGAVQLFALAKATARYAERLVHHDLALRLLARLRTATFRALAPLVPAGLGHGRLGDLLGRVVDDVDALQRLYLGALAPALSALTGAATGAAVAAVLDPPAGLTLAAGLAACGVGLPLLGRITGAAGATEAVADRGELYGGIAEALSGAAELASWGRSDEARRRLAEVGDRLAARARSAARRRGLLESARLATSSATVLAVLWLGLEAERTGRIGGVTVAVLVGLALGATELVAELPGAFAGLEEGLAAGRRVLEPFGRPTPVHEPLHPDVPPRLCGRPPAVAVDRVRVRYQSQGPPALDGVVLELEPGSRIGLVGPSGAGKSTLAHLLLRFVEPERGSVLLEGTDARRLAGDDVRDLVGALDQDAYLFMTTIRENLRVANPDAAPAELLRALAAVGLAKLVASLPRGLDTEVGERGSALSGGEQRRLALARLLLANHRVVVLDEPTADLDPATARRLVEDLARVLADRSLLLVTHRQADLSLVDQVLRLEEGRIRCVESVETGRVATVEKGRVGGVGDGQPGPPPTSASRPRLVPEGRASEEVP